MGGRWREARLQCKLAGCCRSTSSSRPSLRSRTLPGSLRSSRHGSTVVASVSRRLTRRPSSWDKVRYPGVRAYRLCPQWRASTRVERPQVRCSPLGPQDFLLTRKDVSRPRGRARKLRNQASEMACNRPLRSVVLRACLQSTAASLEAHPPLQTSTSRTRRCRMKSLGDSHTD